MHVKITYQSNQKGPRPIHSKKKIMSTRRWGNSR